MHELTLTSSKVSLLKDHRLTKDSTWCLNASRQDCQLEWHSFGRFDLLSVFQTLHHLVNRNAHHRFVRNMYVLLDIEVEVLELSSAETPRDSPEDNIVWSGGRLQDNCQPDSEKPINYSHLD